ncbi:MAG: hypothetical protein AAGA77_19905, partial [Bacteroidota bacterium]
MKAVRFLSVAMLLFSLNCVQSQDCTPDPNFIQCLPSGSLHGYLFQVFQDTWGDPQGPSPCAGGWNATKFEYEFKDFEFHIHEDLYIDLDVKYTNCRFYFYGGSKLVITNKHAIIQEPHPNATDIDAEFIDCEFSGCNELWQGIKPVVYDNHAGPNVTLTGCEIRDAYIALEVSRRGNFDISSTDFIDNVIGMEATWWRRLNISGCTFEGQNILKPPYSGLTLNSNVSQNGIISELRETFSVLNSVDVNSFINLKCAIRFTGGSSPSRLGVSNQIFVANDTCIHAENTSSVSVNRNDMTYNSIGINVVNPKAGAQINIGTGGKNTMSCANNGLCFSAIQLRNVQNAERAIIN